MLAQRLARVYFGFLSPSRFHRLSIFSIPTTMSSSSVSTIGNSLSNDPDLPIERAKKVAAFACGEVHIKSGMKIGVGSGSTVKYLVEFLKERYQQKALKDITCVPTSFMVNLCFSIYEIL